MIPTPPPGQVPPSTPAPWPQDHLRPPSTRFLVLLGVLAIVVAVALGWRVTQQGRTGWWTLESHLAVSPGPDGRASRDGVSVGPVEVEQMDAVTTWSEPWDVPDGYTVWRVGLAVTSTNSDLGTCDVVVQDEAGRLYTAGRFVPYGVEGIETFVQCGVSEEPLPEVQNALVLMPADAEPRYVRVESSWSLSPYYFRLPVGT